MGHRMVMRIKRTIDIAMSNYEGIIGSAVFSYEEKIAYATDNMQLAADDLHAIFSAWNGVTTDFVVKQISFLSAMTEKNGFVAINPEGAIALVVGTGKGVWFVSCFASMDQDKSGILRECIQAAKLLETSVSVLEA